MVFPRKRILVRMDEKQAEQRKNAAIAPAFFFCYTVHILRQRGQADGTDAAGSLFFLTGNFEPEGCARCCKTRQDPCKWGGGQKTGYADRCAEEMCIRDRFEAARKSGYVRVRVDGNMYELTEEIKLEKNKKHTIEIVVDRLIVREDIRSRLSDSLETAIGLTGGLALVSVEGGEEILFSQNYACPDHGVSIGELEPAMFSFNNPVGACEKCTGLGTFMKVDPDLIVPNKNLSIRGGAIKASGWYFGGDGGTIAQMYYDALAEHYGFSLDTPFGELPEQAQNILFYGTNGERIKMTRRNEYGEGTYQTEFEGIVNNLERRFRETQSSFIRDEIAQCMSTCLLYTSRCV